MELAIQSKKLVTRAKTAGWPNSQPVSAPKEVTPIRRPVDSLTNGPPESPLQVEVPAGVATQMFEETTVFGT